MFTRSFEQYLQKWKDNPRRKPLVIRGARQVGKTFVVKKFAKEKYTNFTNINLDDKDSFRLFQKVETVEQFSTTVSLAYNLNIKEPNILVFIDEIQNLPNLIQLLRFFYEDMPYLHVICAGSLLETRIQKEGFAMPVGRVEFGYMYPLTFFEFLDAIGKQNLKVYLERLDLDKAEPVQEGVHTMALELFKTYTMLGGMPEVVSIFAQSGNIEECQKALRNITTAYSDDTYKYATTENIKYLTHILDTGPNFAGTSFKYEGFAQSNFRSREMINAFNTLEKAMILQQIRSTNSGSLPFIAKEKRAKKLLWLDVGFVNMAANSYLNFINLKSLNGLYQGRIAEQVVGQNILASGKMYEPVDLYYWAKDKSEGNAELDYCLQINNIAVGIEIKAGASRKAKSLYSFGNIFRDAKLVKVSEANMDIRDGVFHLPFYLINRIFDIDKP